MRARRSAGSMLRTIGDRVGVRDERPSFMQGLAVGALVGAAIAGSTLWSRWRARPILADPPLVPAGDVPGVDAGLVP
jgi:hypothetical protein